MVLCLVWVEAASAGARPPVAASCTVPAAARFVAATFADINAGDAGALVARIDRRRHHFLAFDPFASRGIRPAPPRATPHRVKVADAIGRRAVRRQAAGERLALTGVKLEGRNGAQVGLTVFYTRTAPDLGDGAPYPAAGKVAIWCRRGTFGAFAGGAVNRSHPRAPDPVRECRLAHGTRPLGRLDGVVLCGRTLDVRPQDRAPAAPRHPAASPA